MGAGKAILIGGVVVGLGAWFLHSHNANAAPAPAQWPPGWTPPAGATTETIPAGAGNPTTLNLKVTRWDVAADASGAQAGRYVLVQNTANPLVDWVVVFGQQGAAGNTQGIVSTSGSQRAGLIAQAINAGAIE